MGSTAPTAASEFESRIAPLVAAGSALASAYGRTMEKYRLLLQTVREGKFTPREVDTALERAGLPAPRICEVKRVAFTSDEIFNAYDKRLIGFRAALEATRIRGGLPSDELRWNRMLCKFDRLTDTCAPTQDFYQGEKFCFFMFPRAGWMAHEEPLIEKTFNVPGWEIHVRRVAKKAVKPKPRKGRKK